MSLAVVLAAIWVICATCVALLPMRVQYVPGALLLGIAPILIGAIIWHHGWIAGLAGLAAVLSMFRRPLRVALGAWRGGGGDAGGGDVR